MAARDIILHDFWLKSFSLVSMGSLNEAIAHPREIFRPAIVDSAREHDDFGADTAWAMSTDVTAMKGRYLPVRRLTWF